MRAFLIAVCVLAPALPCAAQEWWKPYAPPQTERENVFEFTQKPAVARLGEDRYEIAFAVKDFCDVTVGIVDENGAVVRHLASGVLGANAPEPLRKNSLKQTLFWNGKDDLDWYHKEPEKLKVRVMLGLKPEFHKRLGPTSPKALAGGVWGLAADPEGVYVFTASHQRAQISCRKFDHETRYVREMYPPSGALPPEKLGGMGFVEYEPGQRAIHAPGLSHGMWRDGKWMPSGFDAGMLRCRPAVADGRIYLLNDGRIPGSAGKSARNMLHYLNTDGSTEYAGLAGRPWFETNRFTNYPMLAVSPDGEKLYLVGLHRGVGGYGGSDSSPVLLSGPARGEELAKIVAGDLQKPGSDDKHFGEPRDVACDGEGRVYVTDYPNQRVQIFAPDGTLLQTLKAERPELIQVHRKTGVVYLAHAVQVQGKTVSRVSRLAPFPDLSVQRHWDGIPTEVMTLDSWSPQPRLWVSGQPCKRTESGVSFGPGVLLQVFEDRGDELRLVCDFEAEARKEAGTDYLAWQGGIGYQVACDPVREQVYYANRWVFELRTGKLLGPAAMDRHAPAELAFDKRGYLHIRRSGRAPKNVIRVDPSRVENGQYAEVPYDYGVELDGYAGALAMPATDAQFYSWGLGVNMRGDVAALNWIGYSPKFQDEVDADLGAYYRSGRGIGVWTHDVYGDFTKRLQDLERKGEDLFYIRPRPGVDLVGGVVWTYAASGELRSKEAVLIGQYRTNGVQVDEDGFLYFVNGRQRYLEGTPFLHERGGNFGGKPLAGNNRTPFTGTYIKTSPGRAVFQVRKPRIAGTGAPDRPPDLATPGFGGQRADFGGNRDVWADGVEWMYAGASPIVADHCSCPQMRVSLDWYKRSFVPENYRHTVAVLDTNGNLVCRVGQYGNLDSEGIAMTRGAYVSATDNYLVISDWGRRLIVARLDYHAEETVGIAE